jgi:pimeloyl-ACP methyl ester carboxylesterase
MPPTRWKSTIVRLLKVAMGVLELAAPGLGARWVDRIWFAVPPPRPTESDVPSGGAPFELTVSGATVRGRRWEGNGNIIYLVHGWGSSSAQLSPFIGPLLDAGFSVVAYDALSHGHSDPGPNGPRRSNALEHRDVLRAVVAAHGPAHGVIAHSLGSMVAALAMRDGVVPHRAVYIAPMIDITSYGAPFIRMLGAGPRTWARFIKRVERRLGLHMSYFDLAPMADELATPPLLIIHDRDDHETSWQASRTLAGSWPDARLLTTTGLGHNRVLSDPTVISASVAFLRGQDLADVPAISHLASALYSCKPSSTPAGSRHSSRVRRPVIVNGATCRFTGSSQIRV